MAPGPQPSVSTHSSPGVARGRQLSLAEFCAHYEINELDRVKLVVLEYVPGNPDIERAPKEEWQDRAGFAFVSWERFLRRHRRYCKERSEGVWDVTAV